MKLPRVWLPILLVCLLLTVQFVTAQNDDDAVTDAFEYIGALTTESPTISNELPIRRSFTTLSIVMTATTGDFEPQFQLLNPEEEDVDGNPVVLATSNLAEDGATAFLDISVLSYGDYILDASSVSGEATGGFTINVVTTEESLTFDATNTIDDEIPIYTYDITVTRPGTDISIDLREITAGLDTKLYLLEERDGGTIVAENDDDDRFDGVTSSYIYYPSAIPGDYTIIATRYGREDGRSSGEFTLEWDLIEPDLNQVDEDNVPEFNVSQGALLDAGFPIDLEPTDTTPWTILAYYGADTDLEPAIIADLNEFEMAGSNDNLQIIVLMDRSSEYDDSNGDWTTAKIFRVGPASEDSGGAKTYENPDGEYPPQIDAQEIADLGDINSGDGEVFAQFLIWGITYFPADNYVISMGSHGNGWKGIITDDTSSDIITVPEIKEAFRLALQRTDRDKFAYLINDACLMSSVEYFEIVSDYFNYALASPEIVVNPAHDMMLFVELLSENVEAPDFETISNQLIDRYIDRDIAERPGSDTAFLTSALTNLDEFDPVVAAINEFADAMNAQNPVVIANILGQARTNTYTYRHFARGKTKIDLYDLMRRVIQNPNTPDDVIQAAENVQTALDNARLYQRAGVRLQLPLTEEEMEAAGTDYPYVDRIGYYNIYFPEDSDDFDIDYFAESPLASWGPMLRRYYNAVTPTPWEGDTAFHTPIAPKVSIDATLPNGEVSTIKPIAMSLQTIGRNIAYVDAIYDYYEPDGTIVRYLKERVTNNVESNGQFTISVQNWDNGLNFVNAVWDVRLPYLSDDSGNENYEYLEFNEEVGSLEARYCQVGQTCVEDDDWEQVFITFNRDGSFQRVISQSETGSIGVTEIQPGALVQVYRYEVTEDRRTIAIPHNEYIWPTEGMRWEWRPAKNGEYNATILAQAYGGTTGFDEVPFTVNNTDVNPEIKSYRRTDFGYTLPFPEDWNAPASNLFTIQEEGNLADRVVSPDEQSRLMVYFDLARREGSLAEIAAGIGEDYNFEITNEATELTVNEQVEDAVMFNIRVPREGHTYVGRAIAVFNPNINLTMVISREIVEGSGGDLDNDFQQLVDNIQFFDSVAYSTERTTNIQWNFVTAGDADNIRFPIQTSWAATRRDELFWTRYFSPDVSDRTRFFATSSFDVVSQVEDVPGILSTIITGYAELELEAMVITDVRTLFTTNGITWETTLYEATRDSIPVSGRVYATAFQDQTYAAWIETPMLETEDGFIEDIDTIRTEFEPILDGYTIAIIEEPETD